MVTALKRETVYAVGELMKSRMEGRRQDTKLLLAPNQMRSCQYCDLGGGEYRQWVKCDCYSDKIIQPPNKFYCMYWDLNEGRMQELPESLHHELLDQLGISSRVSQFSALVHDMTDALRRLTALIDNLPGPLKTGLPNKCMLAELEITLRNTCLAELESSFSQMEGP